jgi:hypothetical protein
MGNITVSFKRMRFVVQVRHFVDMKFNYKFCLNMRRQYVVVDYKNNVRTYLIYFGSGLSTGFVSISIDDNSYSARAMMSVRDTAIATQNVSLEYEQYSCSVPLVQQNTALFLYDQVADIRPRQTSGVVTKLPGNSFQNIHS